MCSVPRRAREARRGSALASHLRHAVLKCRPSLRRLSHEIGRFRAPGRENPLRRETRGLPLGKENRLGSNPRMSSASFSLREFGVWNGDISHVVFLFASPGRGIILCNGVAQHMFKLRVADMEFRWNGAERSGEEPSRAEPSGAEQSRAERSRAEESRAEPSRAEQIRAEQSRAHRRHSWPPARSALSDARRRIDELQPGAQFGRRG